ncbi:MAG: response regulator [Chloroflexi bacterium]|nr:response regulator [Chloroflexota bacterium]
MKILLIEDNPGDARLVQEALKESLNKFTIKIVEKLEQGLDFLLSEDVDVVMLDMNLPDSQGLETLIKFQCRFPRLPVVIMTAVADEVVAVQAVQQGAQDYLVKGQASVALLTRALSYAIERKKMQQQLLEYEKMAYLGKLSGFIAHEIRNPLATIDTSAYYLEKTLKEPGAKTKAHLERIRSAVNRASAIIKKLIDMSRMKEPTPENLDIAELINDLVKENHPDCVKLVLDLPARPLVFLADKEQLRMALGNIIRNGMEAMSEGGTLTIAARRVENDVEISVRDTGPGIPPEIKGHLFEPFATTKHDSAGFGLAIVKTIIDKHHGTIQAASEPGKGTKFTIRLPVGELTGKAVSEKPG